MWLHATVPGMICAWMLFGPRLRLFSTQLSEAEPAKA
jgi:hypothetical protein